MAQFRSRPFGVTRDGEKVNEYIMSNPGGLAVSVLNYGCVIKNIFVPTKQGPVDVVVGHDTFADYEQDFNSSSSTCCGAFVGRYANRIENAEFSVGGRKYQLEPNNGRNHLHGTFPKKIYDVKAFGDTLLLETESPAGEDGFPGNLKVSVRYILTEDNALRMDYRVSSDADTILNLTNHTYFNLAGQGKGDILGHRLELAASRYTPVNAELIPTGEMLPVAGTPLDFTTPHIIGERIGADCPQLKNAGGYDHNFLLDYDAESLNPLHPAAELSDPVRGRRLTVFTTEPALQLYSGNFLCGERGKGGIAYQKHSGICLETQHCPDSPHHPQFPSILLRQGETYESETVWFFGLTE